MRIAFITRRHPPGVPSPTLFEAARLLGDWGAEITLIYPEEDPIDPREVREDHDLYLLNSGTEAALSLAGALDTLGARILNPFQATQRCRDRIVASRTLDAAGVLVPKSYLEGRPPSGHDLELFGIGDHLFGVDGEPFTITPVLREIGIRCARAFGLRVFGIDVVVSDGQPYVVDINPFPGFEGVPEAALRLADWIYAATSHISLSAVGAGGDEPAVPTMSPA